MSIVILTVLTVEVVPAAEWYQVEGHDPGVVLVPVVSAALVVSASLAESVLLDVVCSLVSPKTVSRVRMLQLQQPDH